MSEKHNPFWCNGHFPVVPRFFYRAADEWNCNSWGLHWLIFSVWSLENFAFGLDVNFGEYDISIGFILPYLRVRIGFGGLPSIPLIGLLFENLRRKPIKKGGGGFNYELSS